jgi:tight adherence protein C
MSPLTAGGLLGVTFALGIMVAVGQWRSPGRVARRILPLVHATGFEWQSPRPAVSQSLATTRAIRLLDFVVTDASVARRLAKAGRDLSVERFRLDQLRWAGMGALVVVGFGALKLLGGDPLAPVAWLVFTLLAAGLGAMACDYWLTKRAAERVEQITAELPAFAELLAFTVAAGLAPASAMSRVADRVGGELAAEVRRTCVEVADGRPFSDSLEAMAQRTGSGPVQRFVDGIVVAMERGTPIADVLRAQAMDARAVGHRYLMESASKREIFALVPVVFLILPAVVVVAVFPGVIGLAL